MVCACIVPAAAGVAMASVEPAGAAVPAAVEAPGEATAWPPESDLLAWLEAAKQPTRWWSWGGDLRLRETFSDNGKYLLDELDDHEHFLRTRTRLRMQLGPFPADGEGGEPGGLSVYTRVANEFRAYMERPDGTEAYNPDEVVLDNLYGRWERIGGRPLSVTVGRYDAAYGRGFVVKDGTPKDGTRTYFSDGAVATVHLDERQSELDLLLLDNDAWHQRLSPLNDQRKALSEFDTTVTGVHLRNRAVVGHELHGYYLYKDDEPVGKTSLPGRVVHTVGGLVDGSAGRWDYYGEAAGQWGREGTVTRRGLGLSTELGHTFGDAAWRPRAYAGYEYLSGDDPGTRAYEAWDPVLGRWRRWSLLYDKRISNETGMAHCWSNLQRLMVGAGAEPVKDVTASVDYSLLLANEHTYGDGFVSGRHPYDSGHVRGSLWVAQGAWKVTKALAANAVAEYFVPGSYYDDETDDAVFLRWEVTLAF
jgi:hypothetical protein